MTKQMGEEFREASDAEQAVLVSCLISHLLSSAKRLKKVKMPQEDFERIMVHNFGVTLIELTRTGLAFLSQDADCADPETVELFLNMAISTFKEASGDRGGATLQ